MVRPTIKKIISGIFILAMIFTYVLQPQSASAAIGTSQLNWDNPNKNGANPYKFKLQNSLDSSLIMNVIGCTGVVNKVSKAVTDFAQDQINDLIKQRSKMAAERAARGGVDAGLGITAATSTSPGSHAGTGLANIGSNAIGGQTTQPTSDNSVTNAVNKGTKETKIQSNTENCLNGIAYTLAKNQLTAMTKSTMNWITSGFGGDPMYVQNMDSFMNNITNSILEKEVSLYKDVNLYPYGMNYSRNAVSSYKAQQSFTGSMQQTLTNYLNFGGLGNDAANLITGNTNNANRYYNNFASGGWDGWLAFTQMPQNNPLGFSIAVSQQIASKQEEKKEQTKTELVTNKGVLDQKKCVKYAPTMNSAINGIAASKTAATDAVNKAADAFDRAEADYNTAEADPTRVSELPALEMAMKDAFDALQRAGSVTTIDSNGSTSECTQWQVITPGSVIQDKISTYVNSPERQLELADTINKSLNALFTNLISKLQHEGLSSLGSNATDFASASGGIGRNKVYDSSGNDVTQNGISSGSGFSGAFDITKDLGNVYVKPTNAGNWDASSNTTTNVSETSLSKGIGTKNTYYVVTIAGTKSLFEGNVSWSVGDIAFFDGTDWKKGVPAYSLDKKGILQIQQDYINNAQKVLKILPKLMPAIGELDYCIPGPNQNWKNNTIDAYNAYSDWLYGIGEDMKAKAFLSRPATRIWLPETTSLVFRNYKKIFDNTGLWSKVLSSPFFNSYIPNGSLGVRDWDIAPFDRMNRDKCGVGSVQTWWKGASCIGKAIQKINEEQTKIITGMENNFKSYDLATNDRYWSNATLTSMNNPFETGYIEMAQTGLAITKNILEYDTATSDSITKYKDGIIESCSNIYKLNKIKDEVNLIVKAAQARRKANGINVDASCTEAELGTYLVDDKILLKGCGNTIVEDNADLIKAKQLLEDTLRQQELDAELANINSQILNSEGTNNSQTTATPTDPGVSNLTTTSVVFNSATVAATVISNGYPTTILDRGFCYYISGGNPSSATCVSSTSDASINGFNANLYPLTPSTMYYYSAYADNETGRGVTPWFTFTTPAQ